MVDAELVPVDEVNKDEAYVRLLVGILKQAAQDLRGLPEPGPSSGRLSKRVVNAIDAHEFLESPTFSLICSALGVKEMKMRTEIRRRIERGDLG